MVYQRGLDTRQEQDPRLLIRDTRTLGQRVSDFFKNGSNTAIILISSAVGAVFYPEFSDLVLVVCLFLFMYCFVQENKLPFRMPLRSKEKDYNDLIPGTSKPRKAGGICFFGNERDTRAELWFTNDDMRTHVLIFGSTGSGKTEYLVSLSYNALVQGSGFIYVDGKGDNSLFSKVFSMCRAMGREDDILLINFMTGARDILGPQEKRLSNTMNPFSLGSSSMLSQLVVSLMDSSSGGSSDGDMWKGRAITFVEGLMKVLVYARDKEYILLDANTIRNYFTLDKIEAMAIDKVLIREGEEAVSLEDAPEIVLEPIYNYCVNLPGYDKSKKGKQVSQVFEQHGFITMQLTRIFSTLADSYGHILRTQLAEVDMKDVVLNRRILVVLLPALEKSPDELANLGKIVIATLRVMMAAGLGDAVEGKYRDVVERKPTNAPTPFMCVLDEYGYYAVKGFAVVPAQARSLGFSVIFAGQDLPAFQKASKEEAASITANTNIKIAMKLEDPVETWDLFSKTAGESFVTKVDAFQTNAQSLTNTYLDTRSSSTEKRARIDLLDLKEQREGEAHIFFKSRIIRANAFYAAPPAVHEMQLNHFLKVKSPPSAKLYELHQQYESFKFSIEETGFTPDPSAMVNEEIELVAKTVEDNPDMSGIERGVATLIAYHNRNNQSEEAAEEEIEVLEDEIHLFAPMISNDALDALLLTDDPITFKKPMLEKRFTRDQAEYVERLSGKTSQHATSIADEIIKDMQVATHYPPEEKVLVDPQSFAETVNVLSQHIDEAIMMQGQDDDDDDDDF